MSPAVPAEPAPRCVNPECRKVRKQRPGQPGFEGGCGFCRTCYDRWRDAGRPDDGVPAPMSHAERCAVTAEVHRQARAARLEDFAELRGQGLSISAAARRVGVVYLTGTRYEAELRKGVPA